MKSVHKGTDIAVRPNRLGKKCNNSRLGDCIGLLSASIEDLGIQITMCDVSVTENRK